MAVAYDPITGLPTTKKTKATAYDPFKPVYAANADPGGGGGTVTGRAPSVSLPGFMPDYKQLIQSNPFFLDAQNSLTSQGIASKAQRTAARQRAITQFGQVPDFMKAGMDLGTLGTDIGEDITPDIAALAQGNTEAGLSTSAQLAKAHSDAVRQIQNALGARGLSRSGETGYQLDEENQNYAQGTYDSTQKLLDYLAGVQSAFTQGEYEREQARNSAATQAAQLEAQLHPPTGKQDLPWNAEKGAYGPDANGDYYDEFKNKVTPGAPPNAKTQPSPPGTIISSTPPPATISDYSTPLAQAKVGPPAGTLNMPGGVSNTWGPAPAKPSLNDLYRLLNGG